MTTKQRFTLDMAYRALRDLCEDRRRMVSAGEFAEYMGISRNTAFNWLIAMLGESAIEYETRRYGNVLRARYGVWGFEWDNEPAAPGQGG